MLKNCRESSVAYIANDKMEFAFSYKSGLKLISILHKGSQLEWLNQPIDPFVLEILGTSISAGAFSVDKVETMSDGAQEYLMFTLGLEAPFEISAKVSVYTAADESLMYLLQLAPVWPEGVPQEIYLHVPLFREFGYLNNQWYLSSNPVKRPDGTSVMQLHDSFDLPICNIAQDQKTGFSIEMRDTNQFAKAWNQLRNCDFLHMTQEEQLINNRILLRLENPVLTDVLEFRFFALDQGWPEAFSGWRKRIRQNMDLREYNREDLQWYRKMLFQHFTFAYSKEVFDYEKEQFDPDRLIEDGEAFGGYDSVLLWIQYPRLGVDQRKQWDFNRDIPGGLAGLREFSRKCHAKGVRVFLPYKPWDIRSDEDHASILENFATVLRETDIDGIWFDTMDQVPEGFRECADSIRPGVLFCTEVHPAFVNTIETITGHWDQFMDDIIMPNCYILRYLFPENNAPITSRWKIGKSKDTLINRAVFNGTGFAVWQDIFGAWLPFSSEQKTALKKWKRILLEHFDTFFGMNSIPMMPVMQNGLYANRFTSDDGKETIYTLYNASEKPIEGELIRVEEEGEIKEIWKESLFSVSNNTISGCIAPEEVVAISIKR